MAALADVDHLAVVERRTHVAPFDGQPCERLQAVDAGHDGGVAQQHGERPADVGHQLGVDALLDDEHLLLGAQNLLLVLLELLGDVALGVGEGLFADPVGGNLLLVGIAHLDVVAEDVVVADFQRRDARRLALALLDAREVVLAVQGDAAQVVQLGIDAVGDDAALLYLVVLRVGVDLAGNALAHLLQGVDPVGQLVQPLAVGGFHRRLEQLERRERVLELHQLAGRHA